MASYIQQLADHIKKNIKKGYTVDALKYSLINQGYTKISVEKAIDLANQQLADEIPSMKERPEIIVKIIEDEPLESNNDNEIDKDSESKKSKQSEERIKITTLPPKKGFWSNLFGN